MPPRGLPGGANLEQLNNGAKTFQRAVRTGDPGAAEVVREFLRLACLNYGDDDPGRWARARKLLADNPELATVTIHTIAAVGEAPL